MSRLATLIRLNRWQLNEQRRRVTELEVLVETTQERIVALDASMTEEGRRAEHDLATRAAYPAYAEAARGQRGKLTATLATISAELEQARESLTAAFQELKKYELAEEARQKRDREFAARRDRLRLDELALDGFRRNSGSD